MTAVIFILMFLFGTGAAFSGAQAQGTATTRLDSAEKRSLPNWAPALDEPGEPFAVGGHPMYGADGAYRASPSAAFDGTNYLVTWEEERNGSLDVFAARVDQSGTVLDPEGILVSGGPGAETRAAVASDGTDYLVVWADSRGGTWDIYGARVSGNGAVLDPDGIAIASAGGDQFSPSVAYSGSRYLVVWSDKKQGGWVDIRGAVVSSDGNVLKRDVLISPGVAADAPGGPWGPSVAGDGSDLMVVWQTLRGGTWDIYGARVTSSGEVLDSGGLAISATGEQEWYPSVAYNGSQYLVAWHSVSGGSYDLFAARVTSDGVLLDEQRIFVSEHRYWQRYPAVASDGESCLVAWANWTEWEQDVYATVVTPDGEVADILGRGVLRAETDIQWRPAVVFGGGRYLVVSQDERSGSGGDIYGMFVDPTGEPVLGDDIRISTEGDGPWRPTAVFDGAGYTVVWGDVGDGAGRIAGARVSAGGVLLDSTPLQFSQDGSEACAPDIAFDGSARMVVRQEGRAGTWDIYGTRLNKMGVVLDGNGIRIRAGAGDQVRPSIAFGGGVYMVVWEDRKSGTSDVYGARVAPNGAVLDPEGIAVSTSYGGQRRPSVAYNGTDFIVVWEDGRNGNWDIYGTAVTVSGEVLDPSGAAVSTDSDDEWAPAIASDGSRCLAAWQRWNGGAGDIIGATLGPAGAPERRGAISICKSAGRQWSPDVAFNGREYVVAWSDARRGPTDVDIYACRVTADGEPLDPDGVRASASYADQLLPSVASGDGRRVLVVNSSLVPSSVFDYSRIWGVLWTPADPPEQGQGLLLQAAPNPFRGSTEIRYRLSTQSRVKISIYDAEGRFVATLFEGDRGAGPHAESWDGSDGAGHRVPAGIYFAAVRTGAGEAVAKCVFVR